MSKGWKLLAIFTAFVLALTIVGTAVAIVLIQNQRADVCEKFSGQIRETIKRGDRSIDKLHIRGYGPKEKKAAHRENRRTLAAFSDRACNSTSSLLP
jgi:hypothetical protein